MPPRIHLFAVLFFVARKIKGKLQQGNMPPRARARGGGGKKSSTAKKTTAPARQKAKDPIKKATTTKKDEPMCPICFDDLKTMVRN